MLNWRLANHQTITNSDFPCCQLSAAKENSRSTDGRSSAHLSKYSSIESTIPSTSLRKHCSDSARPVTSSLSKAIKSCVVLLASCNAWRTLSFTHRRMVLQLLLLIIPLAFFEFFFTAPLNAALLQRRCSICREGHGSISSLSISEGVLDLSPTPSFDAIRKIACNSSGSKDQIVSTIRTFRTV